jgi:hypothetical protein
MRDAVTYQHDVVNALSELFDFSLGQHLCMWAVHVIKNVV